MAPCKAQDHDSLLLAEVLSGQIRSFAFRLNYRVDHEPDFGPRNAVKHFFGRSLKSASFGPYRSSKFPR